MKGRVLLMLLVVLLSITAVSGSHNSFDDFVDLDDVDWFDRGLYFESVPFLDCIDLSEFYAYADSDRFDRWDRDSIKRYKDRLSASDYEIIASENPSDNIDVRDIDDIKDFRCSTREEFNQFADSNRGDRFDRDDYFRLYGYDSEKQYDRIRRHRPYEVRGGSSNIYGRNDGYGGYASRFRPRYQDSRYNYQDSRYDRYSQPRRNTYIEQIGSAHPLSNHYTFLENLLSRY